MAIKIVGSIPLTQVSVNQTVGIVDPYGSGEEVTIGVTRQRGVHGSRLVEWTTPMGRRYESIAGWRIVYAWVDSGWSAVQHTARQLAEKRREEEKKNAKK